MHFTLGLHSCWAKNKKNMTKLLVTRLQRYLPYELSFVCRILSLQNSFRGTCEGISHFGCLILSLLDFFNASVKTQTSMWFSTAGHWWGRAAEGKRKRRKWVGIQGKDGRELNRSLLDSSSASIKYFYYIDSWSASGGFFLCYLQPPHWGFLFP